MARRTKAQPAPEPEELDEELTELDDIEEDEVEEEPEEKPAPKKRATRSRAKKQPEPEPEEDEDDELEEVDEEELEDEKPKRQPPKRRVIEFGTQQLADHVNAKCGTEHSPYTLRALIRKMVKADKFDRNVGEDRSRYEFSGPNDPKVKAIVAFVNEEKNKPKADRSANLEKARAARAEKAAARKAEKAAKKSSRAKAKPADEEIEDDDDFEELDD